MDVQLHSHWYRYKASSERKETRSSWDASRNDQHATRALAARRRTLLHIFETCRSPSARLSSNPDEGEDDTMNKSKLNQFVTLDVADDTEGEYDDSSSPANSPQSGKFPEYATFTAASDGEPPCVAAGILPAEVYESSLSPLRLALRKVLVRCVEWESQVVGRWQVRATVRLVVCALLTLVL
jgi:hypothetical protein